MNLILFEPEELGRELSETDERVRHVFSILRLQPGEAFKAGITGGAMGRARLTFRGRGGWHWEFVEEQAEPQVLQPLILVTGCPRPPVARRLLKDLCTLGVREMVFCSTDLNEKSYMGSRLWRDGLWKKALREGAMQAGSTVLPRVTQAASLEAALRAALLSAGPGPERMALDNGEGAVSWQKWSRENPARPGGQSILAIGPERGWSERERALFDECAFPRLTLGARILRTETACIAAVSLVLERNAR